MGALDRLWLPDGIDLATRENPNGWLAQQRREGLPVQPQVPLSRADRRRIQRRLAKQARKGGAR